MPVKYTGRLGGVFYLRKAKHAYKNFKPKTGVRSGQYFRRGVFGQKKQYHKAIKSRSLAFTGKYNLLKRKIYGGPRGGLVVIIAQRGAPHKHVRPKLY
jgi:hypothetical protein